MAGPRFKRLNFLIDEDLHTAFKVAAAANGEKMTEILIRFIKGYVQKYQPDALKKGRK